VTEREKERERQRERERDRNASFLTELLGGQKPGWRKKKKDAEKLLLA
jgi:hypothetical protein